jgi:hypothetical protein
MVGSKIAVVLIATGAIAAATGTVYPSRAAAQDWVAPDIFAAPVAVMDAPLAVGGPILADPYPGPVYAASPVLAPGALAYCASRYRSFDPASGTFLGYDGLRHPCP